MGDGMSQVTEEIVKKDGLLYLTHRSEKFVVVFLPGLPEGSTDDQVLDSASRPRATIVYVNAVRPNEIRCARKTGGRIERSDPQKTMSKFPLEPILPVLGYLRQQAWPAPVQIAVESGEAEDGMETVQEAP